MAWLFCMLLLMHFYRQPYKSAAESRLKSQYGVAVVEFRWLSALTRFIDEVGNLEL